MMNSHSLDLIGLTATFLGRYETKGSPLHAREKRHVILIHILADRTAAVQAFKVILCENISAAAD